MTSRTNQKRRLQRRFYRNSRMAGTCIVLLMVLSVLLQVGCERQALSTKREQAEQILEDSGIKGGFIVHISCRTGRLTAALCANESYQVHGLDSNPKNVRISNRSSYTAEYRSSNSKETVCLTLIIWST
ncbi:MAG: SH2 domain-containing protein [Planctomycetota bacterium]|jgi:hypothetical protein